MEQDKFEEIKGHLSNGYYPALVGHSLSHEQFLELAETLAPHIHKIGWLKYFKYINRLTTRLERPIRELEINK